MNMPPKSSQPPLTDDEIAKFREWIAAGMPGASPLAGNVPTGGTRPVDGDWYEALTHLSVHRDRGVGEAPGMAGADLVRRGGKVFLDKTRAATLLTLKAIRPWKEKEEGEPAQYPNAADMSGKSFPLPADADVRREQVQVSSTSPEAQPEAHDPQPTGEQPPPPTPAPAPQSPPDPYAGN